MGSLLQQLKNVKSLRHILLFHKEKKRNLYLDAASEH
jgi:hypothetical protein